MAITKDCECRGTGWVKASIPAQFQAEYGGHSWGWAGCNTHFMEADDEPPTNEWDQEVAAYKGDRE